MLWVSGDQNAALVSETMAYPRLKVLNCFLAGGSLEGLKTLEGRVMEFARQSGCSKLRIMGRDGWAKVFGAEKGRNDHAKDNIGCHSPEATKRARKIPTVTHTPIISPQYNSAFNAYAQSLGFDPNQWMPATKPDAGSVATGGASQISNNQPVGADYKGPAVQGGGP